MNSQKSENLNIIIDQGGIGDAIARLPSIAYVDKYYSHVKLFLWVPDYFEPIAKRCLSKNVVVRPFSKYHKYNQSYYTRAFSPHTHTNLSYHMTDHAFNVVVNKQVEPKDKNYIKVNVDDIKINHFNLPEKYVVVSTGFTSYVREWLPKHINEVLDYLINKGYTPVFLGKHETPTNDKDKIRGYFDPQIHFNKGINLIDKTSLLESIKICEGAACVVGLDNGIMHLAACTDVPIVCGFTSVKPETRAPYRHDEMGWNFYPVTLSKEELSCIGCQTDMVFTYEHDFKTCFHNPEGTSDQIQCLTMLDSSRYILQLEKIL